ncbi:ABC transporter substrate-binding protein [Arcobacteraceae bacterium]|nr:ABC transporter substrate-binding protein [Arcobacteraceae bacterium]
MTKLIIIGFILSLNLLSQEIKLGMSTDLSGPIKYIGNHMNIGIQTYLKKNNTTKNSKYTFSLITYDDNYNPIQASKNVHKLIYEDKVLALLGNMGTPASKLTIPMTNDINIAAFGYYTGGKYVRKEPADKNVFNYRISYEQEVKFIISNLLEKGIKPKEIAFLSQNDAYGNSGYFAAIKELKNKGFKNTHKILNGRYNSHSLNVESSLSKLLDHPSEPKVILMFGITKPIIKFIQIAKQDFPNTTFISISPISQTKIIEELKSKSDDLIITQTVPLLSSKLPIIKEFLKEFTLHFPNEKPSLASLEGYIVGKLFVTSINKSDIQVNNRESIIRILSNKEDIDIGLGFKSSFTQKYNQYSSKIWTSIIKNGIVKEYNWNEMELK